MTVIYRTITLYQNCVIYMTIFYYRDVSIISEMFVWTTDLRSHDAEAYVEEASLPDAGTEKGKGGDSGEIQR